MLHCPLPMMLTVEERRDLKTGIGFSTSSAVQIHPTDLSNYPKRLLVLCLGQIFGFEQPQVLLSALELHRQLGVNLVVVYIHTIHSQVLHLLREYSARYPNYLDIRASVELPKPLDMLFDPNVEVDGMFKAFIQHECLYEFRESAEYVGLLEVQDIILPQTCPLGYGLEEVTRMHPQLSIFQLDTFAGTYVEVRMKYLNRQEAKRNSTMHTVIKIVDVGLEHIQDIDLNNSLWSWINPDLRKQLSIQLENNNTNFEWFGNSGDQNIISAADSVHARQLRNSTAYLEYYPHHCSECSYKCCCTQEVLDHEVTTNHEVDRNKEINRYMDKICTRIYKDCLLGAENGYDAIFAHKLSNANNCRATEISDGAVSISAGRCVNVATHHEEEKLIMWISHWCLLQAKDLQDETEESVQVILKLRLIKTLYFCPSHTSAFNKVVTASPDSSKQLPSSNIEISEDDSEPSLIEINTVGQSYEATCSICGVIVSCK
uniref:Glycosyltransferase family 92 protein n=1 Tax=Ditylenchus dipsaci TaxID=166011 RepID=A0A915DQ44_9BILA